MQSSHRLKFFSLIAALDAAGGVGRDQTLPWKLRADMAFFRDVTTNGLPSPLAPLPEGEGKSGIQRATHLDLSHHAHPKAGSRGCSPLGQGDPDPSSAAGATGIQRAKPFETPLHSVSDRGGDQIQNAVIMGRKTWDSLPPKYRPLVGRQNIILSRTSSEISEVPVCPDLATALSLPAVTAAPDVFVIGGGAVFAEAITHVLCKRLILTRIEGTFDCDVFFPAIPEKFACVATSAWRTEAAKSTVYRFRFELWEG